VIARVGTKAISFASGVSLSFSLRFMIANEAKIYLLRHERESSTLKIAGKAAPVIQSGINFFLNEESREIELVCKLK